MKTRLINFADRILTHWSSTTSWHTNGWCKQVFIFDFGEKFILGNESKDLAYIHN